ncbi:TonB-dependent siderophore receptor [Shewanella sp. S23-S33]|uniref:TonB-dependent siderophore receptor n=1 Tax=Shewanella sp. S23-S33 TaxID=3342769 RepID=UPI00372D4C10
MTEQIAVYASRTEIFKPGTYFGEDGQLLEPAEGTNVEGGVKVALFDDTLNMSAAIYETNKDNEPEYAGKGQLPSGDSIYESVDGITTKGYELEIAGRLTDLWDISGGYTHNNAEDKDGLRRQTYLPEDIFKLTTKYNFEDILPGITAGASWRWQSSTFYQGTIWGVDGAPNVAYRQTQSAYSLVDLMFGYQITPSISMQLNINNIFDKNYNRSLWGYADFGEPRNATLSLRWTL